MQKAGDFSHQAQIINSTIVAGIDEKRVREVFSEMSVKAMQECTAEAVIEVKKRIKKFADCLIPRIEKLENGFSAFSDPAFQFLLRKAQITAACSNNEADYLILSELLCQRVCTSGNRKEAAAISKAVEIVNEIDEDALCILTIYYFLTNYYPIIGSLTEGLEYINGIIGKLIDQKEMPNNLNIFERFSYRKAISEHLEMLNIVGDDRTAERCERLTSVFSGYVCIGIKNNTEAYNKAIEILNDYNLPTQLLVSHELLEGYSRLQISNFEMLDLDLWQETYFSRTLSNSESKALHDILKLYEKDSSLLFKTKDAFEKAFEKYDNLRYAKELCDILIPYNYITPIGEVIVKANLSLLL